MHCSTCIIVCRRVRYDDMRLRTPRLPQVNNTLPWALLLHLCFTCWFMGTESLKSEVITDSISYAQPYEDVIDAYEDNYGIMVSTQHMNLR